MSKAESKELRCYRKKQSDQSKTLQAVINQVTCKNSKPEPSVRSGYREWLGMRAKANNLSCRLLVVPGNGRILILK